jgi:hypothetical protein
MFSRLIKSPVALALLFQTMRKPTKRELSAFKRKKTANSAVRGFYILSFQYRYCGVI